MILSETEVREKLSTLPDWITRDGTINVTYKFKDFIQAIEFVNRLVVPSEKSGHHPDIFISYNKVTINLTSHDEGGITQKDFDLAHEIVDIVNSLMIK
ncbi:4a-hydroxytetrahydrobiopterin dehydratase [Geminocystis sp. NIES-3709]|uniref:4a-hydroxytetrahydrobiopterin dehydratase n=1 Tax=Geminocystis sp. NIES-3709 TaxID=1617448 RepID=UPI0005FCB916|nr:4a-hydroxytetrahydrobiopterin dehydratase [Geminocystis sp. NIES-3709]BAQ65797.1 pterin-4-alpha-carbinolamine dehydratase [Geminocystis sp. NIES-3709]